MLLDKYKANFASFLFLLSLLCLPTPSLAATVSVATMKGQSGTIYSFYKTNDLKAAWQIKRPSKENDRIKLCIPAAFTTKSDTVAGIYSINGKVGNRRAISKPIGGAILIEGGNFKIFPTEKGKIFTQSFVNGLQKRKATLFQQFQIVTNGKAARFKDKKLYQMRGIVRFFDGREGVIESKTDISFKTFNNDLAKLGVKNALYTDMGAWDEGWYRAGDSMKIVTIGNDRSKTEKQSNWVTFLDTKEKTARKKGKVNP